MATIIEFIKIILELIRELLSWLASEKSAGILTAITGLVAFFIYRSQIKLKEKEATVIILNEIKKAETAIDEIKNGGDIFNSIISILPNCSWNKYYQIFASRLDNDHFDLLNSFFNNCEAAEKEMVRLRLFIDIAMKKKAEIIQKELLILAKKYSDKNIVKDGSIDINSEYAKEKENILKIFHTESYWFEPFLPKQKFLTYINNLQKISGTVVVEKLKKIARD